jgi:hypothetical protein
MGIFDQAARYATQAEPEAVVARLLRGTSEELRFGRAFDTRTIPLPGGPERTSDLAAVLEGPAHVGEPVLLIFEFQAQHDPDKLDTTFLEAAVYRSFARHGPERHGKFNVQTALIYLKDRCPARVLRMTLGGGSGSAHTCLLWNVADDSAATTLEEVAADRQTWGNLFWVALQAGGGDATVIARWKELVEQRVPERRMRSEMAGITLVFAELAGSLRLWQDALGGWNMTESQVVNGWQLAARIETKRQDLQAILETRFPGAVSAEVIATIQQNDSLDLLHEWMLSAVREKTFEDFVAVLRR